MNDLQSKLLAGGPSRKLEAAGLIYQLWWLLRLSSVLSAWTLTLPCLEAVPPFPPASRAPSPSAAPGSRAHALLGRAERERGLGSLTSVCGLGCTLPGLEDQASGGRRQVAQGAHSCGGLATGCCS